MITKINISDKTYKKQKFDEKNRMLNNKTYDIKELPSDMKELSGDELTLNAIRMCYRLFKAREISFCPN